MLDGHLLSVRNFASTFSNFGLTFNLTEVLKNDFPNKFAKMLRNLAKSQVRL